MPWFFRYYFIKNFCGPFFSHRILPRVIFRRFHFHNYGVFFNFWVPAGGTAMGQNRLFFTHVPKSVRVAHVSQQSPGALDQAHGPVGGEASHGIARGGPQAGHHTKGILVVEKASNDEYGDGYGKQE